MQRSLPTASGPSGCALPPHTMPHLGRTTRRAAKGMQGGRGLRAPCAQGGGGGPDSPQDALEGIDDRIVASAISIGLNGSLAVGGAQLGGVNLWEHVSFSDLQGQEQLTIVLGAIGLLWGYDFLLLGVPWYERLRAKEGQAGTQGSEESETSSSASTSGRSSNEGEAAAGGSSHRSEGGAAASTSSRKKQGVPFNFVLPASVTGSGKDELSWDVVASTMALQQACVAATTSLLKPNIPLPLDGTFIALRELSKELVQRGLIASFIAGWIADRAFEAGIDDQITLLGGSSYYLSDVCRYTAALLLIATTIPPVIAEAQGLSLSVATNWAVLSNGSSSSGGSGKGDELVAEYKLLEAMQSGINGLPARLTLWLHSARGTLKFGAINLTFAATNNLAASLAVAVGASIFYQACTNKARGDLKLTARMDAPPGPRS